LSSSATTAAGSEPLVSFRSPSRRSRLDLGVRAAAAGTDARPLGHDSARSRLDVRAEAARVPLPRLHARHVSGSLAPRVEHDPSAAGARGRAPARRAARRQARSARGRRRRRLPRLKRRCSYGHSRITVTLFVFDRRFPKPFADPFSANVLPMSLEVGRPFCKPRLTLCRAGERKQARAASTA